jgi:hypothetical protein
VTHHGERGQVLPLWAFGIVAMLIMALLVVRAADIIQWQIRAQNAADSAAQAVLALQTQQFNEMNSALYAAAVEEYRIRAILYGLELTAYGNGGCSLDASCAARYSALYSAYLKAVARYNTEIVLLNRITANMDGATMSRDASALTTRMGSAAGCGKTGGGDCGFSYKLLDFSPRTPVYGVQMDARAFILPSLGAHATVASGVNPSLAPARAEVSVCADVPSPLPSFLNFNPKPFRVIARAAATAVMVEQDWFQPGQLNNPWSANRYQPLEFPSGSTATDGLGTDWYATEFGGNGNTAYAAYNGYAFGIVDNEFSAFLGWWNAVPVRPYMGAQVDAQLGCAP